MNALDVLDTNRDEIAALCKQFAVQRLRVFGSAVTEEWSEDRSDFDFLVDYTVEAKSLPPLDRLVGLKLALEALLGRKVDVVNVAQLRNARFREVVDRQARDFYAA